MPVYKRIVLKTQLFNIYKTKIYLFSINKLTGSGKLAFVKSKIIKTEKDKSSINILFIFVTYFNNYTKFEFMKLLKTTLMAFILMSVCLFFACSSDDDNPKPTPEPEPELTTRLDEVKITQGDKTKQPVMKFNYDNNNVLNNFIIHTYGEDTQEDGTYHLETITTYNITREGKSIIINTTAVNQEDNSIETDKYKLTLDDNNKVIEKIVYQSDKETIDEIFTYIWSGNKVTKITWGEEGDEDLEEYALTYSGNNVQMVSNTSRNEYTDGYNTYTATQILSHSSTNKNTFYKSLPIEYIFTEDSEGELLAFYMSDNEISKAVEEIQYKEYDSSDRLIEDQYNKDATDFTYIYDGDYPSEILSKSTYYHKTINILNPSVNKEYTILHESKLYPAYSSR